MSVALLSVVSKELLFGATHAIEHYPYPYPYAYPYASPYPCPYLYP